MKPVQLKTVVVLTAVLSVVCLVTYWEYRQIKNADGAYRLEWVSIMVAQHIKNTGQLPRRWDDLKDDFLQLPEFVGQIPDSFFDLQGAVAIDFTCGIEDLAREDGRQYLRLKSGIRSQLWNPAPDARIREEARRAVLSEYHEEDTEIPKNDEH